VELMRRAWGPRSPEVVPKDRQVAGAPDDFIECGFNGVGLAVDPPELDLDPGGGLTVDVDRPAADDLLGREVDLRRRPLVIGVELHAAEGRAGAGGTSQGV
jgi:hypothetical protein